MKSVVVGLGNDVEENARGLMKALGLSDEETEQKIMERNHVVSEGEVLEGFRSLFED